MLTTDVFVSRRETVLVFSRGCSRVKNLAIGAIHISTGSINRVDFTHTADLIILNGDLTTDGSCLKAMHVEESLYLQAVIGRQQISRNWQVLLKKSKYRLFCSHIHHRSEQQPIV